MRVAGEPALLVLQLLPMRAGADVEDALQVIDLVRAPKRRDVFGKRIERAPEQLAN